MVKILSIHGCLVSSPLQIYKLESASGWESCNYSDLQHHVLYDMHKIPINCLNACYIVKARNTKCDHDQLKLVWNNTYLTCNDSAGKQ